MGSHECLNKKNKKILKYIGEGFLFEGLIMATSVEKGSDRIVIRRDEKRNPEYYVVGEPSGEVLFESNSADEVVQWTVKRHTYNFEITFPYQPSKIFAK